MKEIVVSAFNGALTGAKIGGAMSASAFMFTVGALTYDHMNDIKLDDSTVFKKEHQHYTLLLMGTLYLAPVLGAITGGAVGTAKGIYTSLYGQKVKVEPEQTLPLHQDDLTLTQRKTRREPSRAGQY